MLDFPNKQCIDSYKTNLSESHFLDPLEVCLSAEPSACIYDFLLIFYLGHFWP